MEEKIIRPTTKPEAIKGKLLKYQGTDYCEFLLLTIVNFCRSRKVSLSMRASAKRATRS